MPFVFVWGIPENFPDDKLLQLRENIISALTESMKVDQSWIRVFFPQDQLSKPELAVGGNNNIYVTIETGMFYIKVENDADPKSATLVVAQTIWHCFEGQYEVECFIGNHNPHWVSLIHAKS
jgi:hypothetical protein